MDLRSPHQLEELRGISLCAGYAGLDLGLHIADPRYRTVAYVEREAHAAATLVARMEDEALGYAPVWDDLKSFDGKPWRGRVHIVAAGYPCQPFSRAGRRRGVDDPRHLWPDVARVVGEVQPEWVFCENVEGHVDLGLAEVLEQLESMGYSTKAGLFAAREVGASHRRRRIFILAHANSERWRAHTGDFSGGRDASVSATIISEDTEQRSVVTERNCSGVDALVDDGSEPIPLFAPDPGDVSAWARLISGSPGQQPAVFRTADGLADRVERTRAAGNGVCSLAAALAWRTLRAAHLGALGGATNFQITTA